MNGSPLLAPLEHAFGAAASARRWLYRSGVLRRERASIPVVSVGNLAVGGAGKTPVVIHLAILLAGRGRRVAVLSRGYGGAGRGARIVSRGHGPLLPASDAGDEPVLIASRCPGVGVLVGPRRAELAGIAATELGADLVILDDGFQHLALERDLDVVVLDGAAPFDNGHLLPRGRLRERPDALRRAHLAWIAKADEGEDALRAAAVASRHTGRSTVLARYVLEAVLPPGPASIDGAPVMSLSAIARPDSFRRLLERAGARVVAEARFRDHHAFSGRDLEEARARAREAGARVICCTEKDAVKIAELDGDPPIAPVRIATEILEGQATLDALLDGVLRG